MSIVYRLSQDSSGLFEGACISEARYSEIKWFNRTLFDPIDDESRRDMIEHPDPEYCMENGVECLLFWNEKEINTFVSKNYDLGVD
jgi:hypothetical protein